MEGTTAEVICVGQALVDCILKGWNTTPLNNNVYVAESVSINIGGDAYNESVIVSRLGHHVKLMCGLGRDEAGRMITEKAQASGVDLSAVVYDDEAKSPITNLIVDDKGERKSVSTPAHLVEFFRPDVSQFKGVKVISIASLFRAPFNKPDIVLEVAKAAKEAGAILCADVKVANCNQLMLEDIKEALPYIDYIFPNESEAEFYTGKETYEEMADVLLGYGVKNVIIKTGPEGCFVKNQEECFTVPAYKLHAVDGTGAGDNYAAGFIDGLLHGMNLRECCDFATAAAAICVQSIGATTGVKSREQVLDYLKTTEK